MRVSSPATGGCARVQRRAIITHGRKIPPAPPGQERVRRRAQPQVGGPGPVLQVVAADIFFFPGEIGHFVVEIAPRRQEVGGQEEKFPLGFFIQGGELPGGQPPAHGGFGRQGELIARQMFRGEAQGLLQGLEPGVQGLPRQPIHEIQPQVGETRRPDQRQGLLGLRGGVAALEKTQFTPRQRTGPPGSGG